MLTLETIGFIGVTGITKYDSGELRDCRLEEYNLISTKYGNLVPQYGDPGIRRKQLKSLSFYKSGEIRSISLEQQTEISTSIGIFPAELITFFEKGSIESLFPLNGQISASWSEEEEGTLAQKFHFTFPFGSFKAKIIGLRFYQEGNVRSLILWPNERISIDTAAGKMPVRIGFKLFENGSLESVEPAEPITVKTPIGPVYAFDRNALGIDADKNSLRFDRKGRLISLFTSDIIIIRKSSGEREIIFPKLRQGLMENEFEEVPVKLLFNYDTLIIDDGVKAEEYTIAECTFRIIRGNYKRAKNCDNCSGCNHYV